MQKERHEKSLFKENKMLQTGNDNKARGNAMKRLASSKSSKLSDVKETIYLKQNFNEELSYDHQPKKRKNTYVVEISRGFHSFQYSFGRFIYNFINYAQSYTQLK